MKEERIKEEISRSMNWVLFAALFFTMLASIIGCSKEPLEVCYLCRTTEKIQYDDGRTEYHGVIQENEKLCGEVEQPADIREGDKLTKKVKRCKRIE